MKVRDGLLRLQLLHDDPRGGAAGAAGRLPGNAGEVFLLDMSEPVRIADLARDMIRLSGLEPDVDIEIKYVGLRPGEKLYEELITVGEGIVPSDGGVKFFGELKAKSPLAILVV